MNRRVVPTMATVAAMIALLTSCAPAVAPHARLIALTKNPAPGPMYSTVAYSAADTFRLNANGCVTVGDSIIIGRAGNKLATNGKSFKLAGVGTFNLGQSAEGVGGEVYSIVAPTKIDGCGAGPYVVAYATATPAVVTVSPRADTSS